MSDLALICEELGRWGQRVCKPPVPPDVDAGLSTWWIVAGVALLVWTMIEMHKRTEFFVFNIIVWGGLLWIGFVRGVIWLARFV